MTWTCTDNCSNVQMEVVTFTVRDNTGPIIKTPPSNMTVPCGSDTQAALNAYIASSGGMVVEDCSDVGPIVANPSSVTVPNPLPQCPWTRRIAFSATDACGHTTTAYGYFTVTDTTPPSLTGGVAGTFECNDNAAKRNWLQTNAGFTCTDNCGATTITRSLASTTGGYTAGGCPTVETWTFTCTDACGNSISKNRTRTTTDTEPPVKVARPTNTEVECDGNNNNLAQVAFEQMWAPGTTGGIRWANDECHPNPVCAPDYQAKTDGYVNTCSYCQSTYDPVCASGTTYPNSCYAYCSGVYQFTPGSCSTSPPVYAPVTAAPVTRAPVYSTPPPATGAPVYSTPPPATGAPVYSTPPPAGSPTNADTCAYCSNEYTPVCVGGTQQFDNYCQAYVASSSCCLSTSCSILFSCMFSPRFVFLFLIFSLCLGHTVPTN